jgi:hypothetical protein
MLGISLSSLYRKLEEPEDAPEEPKPQFDA